MFCLRNGFNFCVFQKSKNNGQFRAYEPPGMPSINQSRRSESAPRKSRMAMTSRRENVPRTVAQSEDSRPCWRSRTLRPRCRYSESSVTCWDYDGLISNVLGRRRKSCCCCSEASQPLPPLSQSWFTSSITRAPPAQKHKRDGHIYSQVIAYRMAKEKKPV